MVSILFNQGRENKDLIKRKRNFEENQNKQNKQNKPKH